jgi:hypothetical protein
LPGLFWRTEYRFASYDNERLSVENSERSADRLLSEQREILADHPQ